MNVDDMIEKLKQHPGTMEVHICEWGYRGSIDSIKEQTIRGHTVLILKSNFIVPKSESERSGSNG